MTNETESTMFPCKPVGLRMRTKGPLSTPLRRPPLPLGAPSPSSVDLTHRLAPCLDLTQRLLAAPQDAASKPQGELDERIHFLCL